MTSTQAGVLSIYSQNIQICSISLNLVQICLFRFRPTMNLCLSGGQHISNLDKVLSRYSILILLEDDEIPYNLSDPESHVFPLSKPDPDFSQKNTRSSPSTDFNN